MQHSELLKKHEFSLSLSEVTRADLALARELAPLSRRALKPWFEQGRVCIDGRKTKASELLAPGSRRVEIDGWDELRSQSSPQASPAKAGAFLDVIYEDENLLVLDKKPGVPSVPLSTMETETAVGAALARCPRLAEVGGGLEPGLIHRLDTGTSGLLAFAKSLEEFSRIRALWKTERVTKTYRALLRAVGPDGEIPPPLPELPHRIELDLVRSSKTAKRVFIASEMGAQARGKPLKTVTHLVRAYPSPTSLRMDLEIRIETGVMHQIRATLSHLGYPVLGDPIYGGTGGGSGEDPIARARLWLHHWRLRLPLPSGKELELEAPLPRDWNAPAGAD